MVLAFMPSFGWLNVFPCVRRVLVTREMVGTDQLSQRTKSVKERCWLWLLR